jgi:serine/threonine protein kinase
VRYLAVTDNAIYAEHYIGSLEYYLTPDMKPPVFEWTLQLCSAIAYLHGLNYAHCHVTHYNVLVGKGGSELLLGDFGTVECVDTPCRMKDDGYGTPENAITTHQTIEDFSEYHPCHATDVYMLGLVTWFMQNGGKPIPKNYIWLPYPDGYGYYIHAIHSHLDIVDFTELQLVEFMRACWAPSVSRPTSKDLLDRLPTMRG